VWRLASKGLLPDQIADEIRRNHPDFVAKYRERLDAEVQRSYDKWKAASSGGREKQTDTLLRIAGEADLFRSPDGKAYADILVNGYRETWRIGSQHMRDWLRHGFFKETGSAPNAECLKSAVATLEARAQFGQLERRVHQRVAFSENCICLDLCNENWEAVEITAHGWKVVSEPEVRFTREPGMLQLPVPEHGGSIDLLRSYLNMSKADDDDDSADDAFVLAVSYACKALYPVGPYPVLAVTGEHGSAKSTFLKVLQALLDPNSAGLLGIPHNPRDIHIAGGNCHVLAFDNLSKIEPWLSDTLCRITSGSGHRTRALYTDAEEQIFHTMRPPMIGSIKTVVTGPDLADRSLFLNLGPIPKEQRRSEREFWQSFERDRPKILGALLDGLVHGLRELQRIERLVAEGTLPLPRMADFAMWANACEGAFFPEGSFNAAYDRNRSKIGRMLVDAHDVANALRDYMERQPGHSWTGTFTDLLNELGKERTNKDWPKSAAALSGCLKEVRPWLTEQGIVLTYEKRTAGRRPITITMTPTKS
jgi:hypothetical protein